MSRELACGLAISVAAIVTGSVFVHYADNRANESTVVEQVQVQEQVFVCTDKYGTSQERFGVKSVDRYDQMWHVKFADGTVGRYLQMHGEWCYVLPVEEVKEEK